jgi:long-chain fatty acid transport protein
MSHNQFKQFKQMASLLATSALFGVCTEAWSAAYQLMEQNVTNLGYAYAGTAALADDASTGFYNSAGLTRICEEQVVFSVIGIKTTAKIKVNRAFDTIGQPVTTPALPISTRIIGDGLSPGFHYAYRLNDCFVFGFNVTMPFGLKTGYREDSAARYSSTRSELRTYNFSPSLAYDFCNGFSLGAGLDIMHVFAQLDTQINVLPTGVGTPPVSDGFRVDKAENWGVGGHIGALYQFNECSRLGVNYRSPVTVNARGQSIQQNSATLAPAINRFDLSAKTTLPGTAVISGYHQICNWAILADIQWTQWSTFQGLTLRRVDGDQRLVQKFRDSFRFALGAHYQLDECWLFRVGTAYDQSPVRNELRSTRIPDSDRYWLAVGARYTFSPCLRLELGYSHVFFRNSIANDRAPTSSVTALQGGQFLNGSVRSAADLLGIQITWDLA